MTNGSGKHESKGQGQRPKSTKDQAQPKEEPAKKK
jgi:hypothetical protein